MPTSLDEPRTPGAPVVKRTRLGETFIGALVSVQQRDVLKRDEATGDMRPVMKTNGKARQELVLTLITMPGTTAMAGIGDSTSVPEPGDNNPSRSAPIGSVDAGMIFERLAGRRGQRLLTFEPRVLYLYVPFRDQADLPVFDTALPDLNIVQLFRRNRYVGADRLSDSNQLSAGATARLESAQAALGNAKLMRSYTVITAPTSGVVA